MSASDPDGDAITLSYAPLITGASFTDNGDGTGSFSWTPTYDDAGSYPVYFYANDGLVSDSDAVTITVNDINRGPSITAIADQSVDENSPRPSSRVAYRLPVRFT